MVLSKQINRWVILLFAGAVAALPGCGNETASTSGGTSSTAAPANPNDPVVVVETSMGPITIELFAEKAPITVKNFLAYVDDHFYDGTIFHRVMPNFMIQGGGFEPNMTEKKTRANIKNESSNGLSNQRGTLAMARTPDPDSASAQFFINTVDNLFLDRARADDGVGYCVFGKVLDGMAVVDKIEKVPTGVRFQTMEINAKMQQIPHEGVPVTDVLIKSVRRAK